MHHHHHDHSPITHLFSRPQAVVGVLASDPGTDPTKQVIKLGPWKLQLTELCSVCLWLCLHFRPISDCHHSRDGDAIVVISVMVHIC